MEGKITGKSLGDNFGHRPKGVRLGERTVLLLGLRGLISVSARKSA